MDRYYWWKECAGILFETKHYKIAEAFYKKAIYFQKKESNFKNRFETTENERFFDIKPLVGDCLFFQGKFEEASGWFNKHLKKYKKASAEWILKKMMSDWLSENKLSGLQIDRKKSDDLLCKLKDEQEPINQVRICREAISLNPLNGNAWFNLGIFYQSANEQKHSLDPFLMAALIHGNDNEALFNALFLSMMLENTYYLTYIAIHGYEIYGDKFINMFTTHIFSKVENFDMEAKKAVVTGLEVFLEKIK